MDNKRREEQVIVRQGSGNVFADLGLPDAAELQAKSGLVFEISRLIRERSLTQKEAAALLGIDQPKISQLLRGGLEGFSTDRLLRFLNALGQDIEIVVSQSSQNPAIRISRAS
jgi:predicted XRE-type DNA-binding protein